jgi:transcriptional regulator with XRE-family HTH domain
MRTVFPNPPGLPYHEGIMDAKTIRHQNLLLLAERYRTQKEFAAALGVSGQRIGHLLGGTPLGTATARRIERIHHLPEGWMDLPHGATDALLPYAPLPLPPDRRELLAVYEQMSPAYQTLARQAVAAFLALERSRPAPALGDPPDAPAPDA